MLAKVSQAIDRKADKKRLKCRVRDERVTAARRGPAEDAVRGKRGKIWEERSISSRSWHNHFHINGKLQLDSNYRGESCSAREAGVAGNSIHGVVMRSHAATTIA